MDCWELTSLPREYAGYLVVRITSICPFHRRSPDHALARIAEPGQLLYGYRLLRLRHLAPFVLGECGHLTPVPFLGGQYCKYCYGPSPSSRLSRRRRASFARISSASEPRFPSLSFRSGSGEAAALAWGVPIGMASPRRAEPSALSRTGRSGGSGEGTWGFRRLMGSPRSGLLGVLSFTG